MVRILIVAAMFLAAALMGVYYVRALEKKSWPVRKKRLSQTAIMFAWLYMAYRLIQWLKL